jgi:hypothetical protein
MLTPITRTFLGRSGPALRSSADRAPHGLHQVAKNSTRRSGSRSKLAARLAAVGSSREPGSWAQGRRRQGLCRRAHSVRNAKSADAPTWMREMHLWGWFEFRGHVPIRASALRDVTPMSTERPASDVSDLADFCGRASRAPRADRIRFYARVGARGSVDEPVYSPCSFVRRLYCNAAAAVRAGLPPTRSLRAPIDDCARTRTTCGTDSASTLATSGREFLAAGVVQESLGPWAFEPGPEQAVMRYCAWGTSRPAHPMKGFEPPSPL